MRVTSSAQPSDPADLAPSGAGHRFPSIEGKARGPRDRARSDGALPAGFLAFLQVALAPLAVIAQAALPTAGSRAADAGAASLRPEHPAPSVPIGRPPVAADGVRPAPGGQGDAAPGDGDPVIQSVSTDDGAPADRGQIPPEPGADSLLVGAPSIELGQVDTDRAGEPSPRRGPATDDLLRPSTAAGQNASTPPRAPTTLVPPRVARVIDPLQPSVGVGSGRSASSYRIVSSATGARAPTTSTTDGTTTVTGADASSDGLAPPGEAIAQGRLARDRSGTPVRDPGDHRSADHREANPLAIPGVSATAESAPRFAAEATREVTRNVPAQLVQLVQPLPPVGTTVVMQLDPPLLGSVLLRVVANQSGRIQLHFRVEDPAVRDALASSRPQIESALLAQGLSPSGFSVDLGSVQTQTNFSSSDQTSDPNPRPRGGLAASTVEPDGRSVLDQYPGEGVNGGRYVDYRL